MERAKELHTSWATIRLYLEVLAPNAANLFATKANAAQDVFGATWFSSASRKVLCENEQVLREIFITLVGRQGDRDAKNQTEDNTTVLKGLRADCRLNGFNRVWERAVVEERGRVGYLEVLRFCWDYGLHPGIPNNGEDNFLVAHLFVGASHSTARVVPEEEHQSSMQNTGGEYCAKLRCLVPTKEVDNWLADYKLNQALRSDDPALLRLLAQLSAGGGRVSPVKVRDFVEEYNIGFNRRLSPGELYTIVREMERSIREAGIGDICTMQTCLGAVAHARIVSDAVNSRKLSYGEFTSFFGALSQLQPGLRPSWRKAALHGITRQDSATSGAVMEQFMSKIESVHLLLSEDAVRGERLSSRNVCHNKTSARKRHISCGRQPPMKAVTAAMSSEAAAAPSSPRPFVENKTYRRAELVGFPGLLPQDEESQTSISPPTCDRPPGSSSRPNATEHREIITGGATRKGRTVNLSRTQNASAEPGTPAGTPRPIFSTAASGSGGPSPRPSSSVKQTTRRGGSSCSTSSASSEEPGSDDDIGPAQLGAAAICTVCEESIAATAAGEIERKASMTAGETSSNIGEDRSALNSSAGLDVDGFVRVCNQLLRDNFLVKEHEDLLQRLRGWMEHYRLPSRMASFKREVFAIGCPTETTPRPAASGDRRRRVRTRPAGIVPHAGPCLIDLWTGKVVARNTLKTSPLSASGKAIKVDDLADRAILNQIANKIVDQAARATSSIATISSNGDAGGDDKTLVQPVVDKPLLVDGGDEPELSPVGNPSVQGKLAARASPAIESDDDGSSDLSADGSVSSAGSGISSEKAGREPQDHIIGEHTCRNSGDEKHASEGNGERISGTTEAVIKNENKGDQSANRAGWKGQVTAREIAKKLKAHQLHVSNTVVRILGRIRLEKPVPTPTLPSPSLRPESAGTSSEEGDEIDVVKDSKNEVASGSNRDPPCGASADGMSDPLTPISTPDDYATVPSNHPSQQLLEVGKALMRRKRPEQAVVAWGQAADILRNLVMVDPRQILVVLLQISSALESLGRIQDVPSLLLEAEQNARLIASWQENKRLVRNRRLEATVVGKLGWAYIKVGNFERALETFRRMDKRLRGEAIEPVGDKASDSNVSRVNSPNVVQQSNELPTTREDIELSWESIRGASTALVGLGRGAEALAEAVQATELADQLAESVMQAESEGLSGRAWQSIAAEITEEARLRQASIAFEVLSGPEDEGDEQEGAGKRRIQEDHNKQNGSGSHQIDRDEHDDREKFQRNSPVVGISECEGEVVSTTQIPDSLPAQTRRGRAKKESTSAPCLESGVNGHDGKASERKAAGCFQRQVALLRRLDRFSTPLPHLEVELDFSTGDDGVSMCPSKTKKCKRAQRAEHNAHVAVLQGLLELGKIALSLGEVDSAAVVFKRRLRLAESGGERPSLSSNTNAQDDEPSVLHVGLGPSIVPYPAKRRVQVSNPVPLKSSSRDTVGHPTGVCRQHKYTAMAVSSAPGLPEEPSLRGRSAKTDTVDNEKGSALDVAEALWWLAVSKGRQDLGIDLTSSPRFLPFNVRPRLPQTARHDEICTSTVHERIKGAHVQCKVASSNKALNVAPSRPEPLYKSDADMPIDDRPRTTSLCGEANTDYLRDHSRAGCIPIPSHAYPGVYLEYGTRKMPEGAKKRRPSSPHLARNESGWDIGAMSGDSKVGKTVSLGHVSESSHATARYTGGIGGAAGGDVSCVPGVAPFVSNWPAEEAIDELMKGSLLWRESGFGRVTELIKEGVLRGIGGTCRPIIDILRRQLAIEMAFDSDEETSVQPSRKHAVARDALIGLGTLALLCGDGGGGCVLYERAAETCRSSGDWIGLANALAAKARLHLATGCFAEASSGFKVVLKLACELGADTLAASAHSFLGWAIASQGRASEASDHFRRWRKLAFRNRDSSSAAASELCIAHMHLRLATSPRGDGGQRACHDTPQTDPDPASEQASSHAELVEARRHYHKYLRWAERVKDACGVWHANMCLAQVYQAMGDEASFEHHRRSSLEGYRRRGAIDVQGKIRAQEHEEVVRGMLQRP